MLFRPEHRSLAHRFTTCVRPDYGGSICHIRSCGEVTSTSGPATPSRAFSRSTSRSNLEASAWSSANQVDRSAPPRQQQRSHSDSLETSCQSRSFESDATVQADFALTTTINGGEVTSQLLIYAMMSIDLIKLHRRKL